MTVIKDMALTLEDFHRGLDSAMDGLDFEVNGGVVRAGDEAHSITIAYKSLPTRVLGGLLEVPRGEVAISFQGYSEDERTAFLQRFDRSYQRGGG
jgi:hypothetical protein